MWSIIMLLLELGGAIGELEHSRLAKTDHNLEVRPCARDTAMRHHRFHSIRFHCISEYIEISEPQLWLLVARST